jgi:hypothetical protein
MSQKITVTDHNYITLEEAVLGALNGKEDLLVSLNNNAKAVLFDGSAPAFGAFVSRLQDGQGAIRVRPLGKNGTVRCIQSAAITPGARVMAVNASARVATATATNRSLGFKLSPFAGAAGDVIEICDAIEVLPA